MRSATPTRIDLTRSISDLPFVVFTCRGRPADYATKILLADIGIAIPRINISIGLIIFDCDGVLVDSERIAHRLLAQIMTSRSHPMTTAEWYEQSTTRS